MEAHKPSVKKWENFKHDFREAHLELRETGGTIDDLGFHNANAIVYQMMARLQIDEYKRTATATATATQHATELASTNQANTTMESQIQTLRSQVQALQLTNTPNHGSNYGCGRGHGRGRGAGRGCRRARPSTPPTPKYCWTHGNCGHVIEECTYPANGHKKEASFAHMISGSTNRCYNITA